VRSSTSGAVPPTYRCIRPGDLFAAFSSVSIDEIINAVWQLPNKSSAADPMPTSVMKQVVHLVAAYFPELFNCSLAAGHFPSEYKEAFIAPIVKKAGLDTTDVSSYRPISDLSVVSKLLERIVARQLMAYLSTANRLPTLQSGFRPGHSTETAILQVMSELLQAVDRGEVGALILLDLTAAFNTVDHDILLQGLQQTFGIDGNVHRWFLSYLVSSRQSDAIRSSRCSPITHHPSSVRCAAGISSGTAAVHFVHLRPHSID